MFQPGYEAKTGVDRVSFDIAEGETVGYIGVNGVGKSTTIKVLTGILMPTSGRASVWSSDSAHSCGGTWRSSSR